MVWAFKRYIKKFGIWHCSRDKIFLILPSKYEKIHNYDVIMSHNDVTDDENEFLWLMSNFNVSFECMNF